MNRNLICVAMAAMMFLSGCAQRQITLTGGEAVSLGEGEYSNFSLTGEFLSEENAVGMLTFGGSSEGGGYELVLHNGPVDGSLKTGSLAHVRNLYRSLAQDGRWTLLELAVRGKNISVKVNGTEVVCYSEPSLPYRLPSYRSMMLGRGRIRLAATHGTISARRIKVRHLPDDVVNPYDTLPPVNEAVDEVIRFQQADFPVIDWHVHLKGGLKAGMAQAKSMNYGINYGVAPNAGAGGVGRMLADDAEVYAYYEEVKDMPFIPGVQGEGRRWTADFSQEALGIFDYLFTDAMTIVDQKGRLSRIYRNEEIDREGLTDEQYMDMLADQTVKILSNEPADFFANAFFLPEFLAGRFDDMWTDDRVDRVLNVMKDNGIAMEINARYKIPSERIIRKAKEAGIKFTFGTNNVDADFGRLEYCLEMARRCALTPQDMWWPVMSTRASRPTVIYNLFGDEDGRVRLFNGIDLEGWTSVTAEDSDIPVFSVEDGCITVSGKPNGYLRTNRQFGDYSLYAEWRWIGEGTNSGIFNRVQEGDRVWPHGFECQLKAGRAGDLICLGGGRMDEIPFNPEIKFPKKTRRSDDSVIELTDGQWNRAEIICRGRHIMVYINGSLENEGTVDVDKGYIALQSEGGALQFRNIWIKPL